MTSASYDQMKDSGIDWLSKLPLEWPIKRAKYVFSRRQEKPKTDDKVVTAFRDGEVIERGLRRSDGFTFADKEIGYQRVTEGDLVIHAMDAFAGAIGVSKSTGKMSPVCSICYPNNVEINTKYYAHLLRSMTKTNYLVAIAKGIRERSTDFRYSDFGNMSLPVPELEVQNRIVDYIEREIAKIDLLIAKQEKLLELIEEKRRATITQAVTRGIDPNAELKETGIPWLGKIPTHWSSIRLKYLCDIKTGDKDTVNSDPEGIYPFFVRSQEIERINSYSEDCEAVLTAGDGAGVGKVFHYYKGRFDFHQRVYMLNNFQGVLGKFVYHHLKENFYKVALEGRAKSTVDSIRMPWLLDFWVALPTLDEQKAIIEIADNVTSNFFNLQNKLLNEISLLNERRTALISHAVTGKIRI